MVSVITTHTHTHTHRPERGPSGRGTRHGFLGSGSATHTNVGTSTVGLQKVSEASLPAAVTAPGDRPPHFRGRPGPPPTDSTAAQRGKGGGGWPRERHTRGARHAPTHVAHRGAQHGRNRATGGHDGRAGGHGTASSGPGRLLTRTWVRARSASKKFRRQARSGRRRVSGGSHLVRGSGGS